MELGSHFGVPGAGAEAAVESEDDGWLAGQVRGGIEVKLEVGGVGSPRRDLSEDITGDVISTRSGGSTVGHGSGTREEDKGLEQHRDALHNFPNPPPK